MLHGNSLTPIHTLPETSCTLFGVAPHDGLTFSSVAVLLLAVTLAACAIPACRAMRVDPIVTLRHE